jgi:hypothetical protein
MRSPTGSARECRRLAEATRVGETGVRRNSVMPSSFRQMRAKWLAF